MTGQPRTSGPPRTARPPGNLGYGGTTGGSGPPGGGAGGGPGGAFWDELDDAQRAALREAGRPRKYQPRMPLCYQGDDSDHLIVIESGWAKVTTSGEDGREVVLAVRGPGDLVCESAVLGGRERSATVAALGQVRALVVPAVRFTAFLDAHPGVWMLVSGTFVRRLDDAGRRLQAHVSAQGARRLAILLADLAERSVRHARPDASGGVVLGPPLSQEELGSWMDASRETVARALSTLRAEGLVRTGWRKIIVMDAPRLRAYARGHHRRD
ncbi:Crp/Fnr family transcriptional regulator [Actinomadura welshii]